MTQRSFTKLRRLTVLAALLIAAPLMEASSGASQPEDIKVETVATDLGRPLGMAIRPTSSTEIFEFYVADARAGRVIRFGNTTPNDRAHSITGFVAKPNAEDSLRDVGPHSLMFLDSTRLVIAGGDGDGHAFVRLYELTDEKKPLTAEQHEQNMEPPKVGDSSTVRLDTFHGLTRTLANEQVPDLVVTAAIGPEGATTWKLPIRAGTLGDLKPLGDPQQVEHDLPIVEVEPRGHIVFVRPTDSSRANSSRLQFVNPINNRVAFEVDLPLGHIAGMTYSPRTGDLYAIVAPPGAARGGVYRIDAKPADDGQATATKIADIARPTAITFGPDGALYVTSLGDKSNDDKGGSLVKISGDLK